MEPSEESEYSDSSRSSADEEESEIEPLNVAPYVPPKYRAPVQTGVLPHARAKKATSEFEFTKVCQKQKTTWFA